MINPTHMLLLSKVEIPLQIKILGNSSYLDVHVVYVGILVFIHTLLIA